MNPLDPAATLADELVRDHVDLARRRRLASIARCCQPSTYRRAAARAVSAARTALRRPAAGRVACCG